MVNRYKDENQYKNATTGGNNLSNSTGSHNRQGSQGLTDLTNIIKPARNSLFSEEQLDKPQNLSSSERQMEDMGRILTEVLNDLRTKLNDVCFDC